MKKLLSIIAIGASLSMSSLYANDATVINLAGKQRMLTQKMSKEALFITKGIDADKNKEALAKTEGLFDKTLTGLINGDKDLDLPKNENKEIVTQLNKVSELWKSFKTSIDKVVAGKSDKATLEAIAKENLPLLKNMNQAVGMFAKASASKLSPEVAKTLNRAGKQRMLTQKMTKELLLVANGIDADENKANAKKTGELFESTLTDLTTKCKNDEIKKQLGVVAKLWGEYKSIIEKADVSDTSLKKAEELNIPLLKNMNKAVKMYEANAK
jgi:nitrate/nitrite-specific signal transduction histidine kinase